MSQALSDRLFDVLKSWPSQEVERTLPVLLFYLASEERALKMPSALSVQLFDLLKAAECRPDSSPEEIGDRLRRFLEESPPNQTLLSELADVLGQALDQEQSLQRARSTKLLGAPAERAPRVDEGVDEKALKLTQIPMPRIFR